MHNCRRIVSAYIENEQEILHGEYQHFAFEFDIKNLFEHHQVVNDFHTLLQKWWNLGKCKIIDFESVHKLQEMNTLAVYKLCVYNNTSGVSKSFNQLNVTDFISPEKRVMTLLGFKNLDET